MYCSRKTQSAVLGKKYVQDFTRKYVQGFCLLFPDETKIDQAKHLLQSIDFLSCKTLDLHTDNDIGKVNFINESQSFSAHFTTLVCNNFENFSIQS